MLFASAGRRSEGVDRHTGVEGSQSHMLPGREAEAKRQVDLKFFKFVPPWPLAIHLCMLLLLNMYSLLPLPNLTEQGAKP